MQHAGGAGARQAASQAPRRGDMSVDAGAFALDVTGPWHAHCPREGGELVFFALDLESDGSTGSISGSGTQLHDGRQWPLRLTGELDQDRVTLALVFGGTDTEVWKGEFGPTEMRLSYARKVRRDTRARNDVV
jgi:hypothetical protein